MKFTPNDITRDKRLKRPGNLTDKLSLRSRIIHLLLPVASGIFLSFAFPPLEWSFIVWFSFIPLMIWGFMPHSHPWRMGYIFGFVYFTTTFSWLREVFFLAPIGMAAICAIFPACWLALSKWLTYTLEQSASDDVSPQYHFSLEIQRRLPGWKMAIAPIGMACFWCTTEWVRSWFLSGFPWNQLGISQWKSIGILPVASYTGVYGISFIIITVNGILYFFWRRLLRVYQRERGVSILLPLLIMLLCVVCIYGSSLPREPLRNKNIMTIGTVQGNIPQSRQWSPERLNLALEVYFSLTKQMVSDHFLDLIVWPETAIPASLTSHPVCQAMLKNLFQHTKKPLITGTIDYRFSPNHQEKKEIPRSYNSAIWFDASGAVLDTYDKIHLVPFGEYVPLGSYFPQLVEWIGMGRSLFPGREYTIFSYQKDVRIGINICFEDIFPEISRRMVRNGANLLIVITNDAWFRESSGSRQHLAHTVFRAVENGRPILRNGNNSDTCLILSNGYILDLLYDQEGKNRFVRRNNVYYVPVWDDPPLTYYTRNPYVFITICGVTTLAFIVFALCRYLNYKKKVFELVQSYPSTIPEYSS